MFDKHSIHADGKSSVQSAEIAKMKKKNSQLVLALTDFSKPPICL